MFSAVHMLVDWLVGSVSRSREARLCELPNLFLKCLLWFEKVCCCIFFEPKRKRSRAGPRNKAGERKSREQARRVEDLNGRGPRELYETGRGAV